MHKGSSQNNTRKAVITVQGNQSVQHNKGPSQQNTPEKQSISHQEGQSIQHTRELVSAVRKGTTQCNMPQNHSV